MPPQICEMTFPRKHSSWKRDGKVAATVLTDETPWHSTCETEENLSIFVDNLRIADPKLMMVTIGTRKENSYKVIILYFGAQQSMNKISHCTVDEQVCKIKAKFV